LTFSPFCLTSTTVISTLSLHDALPICFLDELGEGSGALWDVHHPYRFNDESIAQTIANLGGKIKYVHLKDSVIEKGKVSYRMMGDRKSTRLNSSHVSISYAVFCLNKKA